MFNLPEADILCRALDHEIHGRIIASYGVADFVSEDIGTALRHTCGRIVERVRRVGTKVCIDMTGDRSLMATVTGVGGIRVCGSDAVFEYDPLSFWLDMDGGLRLGFSDGGSRMRIDLVRRDVAVSSVVDANDKTVTGDYLREKIGSDERSVWRALISDDVVGGLGPEYASEALHVARANPLARCLMFDRKDWDRIAKACHQVLDEAIAANENVLGTCARRVPRYWPAQRGFRVWDREGEACHRCLAEGFPDAVASLGFPGLGEMYWCPRCQTFADVV